MRNYLLLAFSVVLSVLPLRAAADSTDWTYTVRPGDTLWSICQRFSYYDKCWQELGQYNGVVKDRAVPIGSKIRMPVDWLQAPLQAATVTHAKGEISIVRDNQELPAIDTGDVLEIGDRIVLGEGELVILFADGSKLMLDPQSELYIDAVTAIKQTRQSEIEVSLPRGSARVQVLDTAPRNIFRVRTTTGVAAVRGTIFRVRNDAENPVTRTEVLEGNVDYSAENITVGIDQGFGSLAEYGKPPSEPIGLLPAPAWLPQCDIPQLVEWEALAGADHYLLELLEDDAETTRTIARFESDTSYYEFTGLDAGCYRLRVQGVENGFYGMESTRNYCYQPVLAVPTIKVAQLQKQAVAIELEPVAGADKYIVELAGSENFDSVSHTIETDQLAFVELLPNDENEYQYARVRAQSEALGETEPSGTVEVKSDDNKGLIWTVIAIIAAFALL